MSSTLRRTRTSAMGARTDGNNKVLGKDLELDEFYESAEGGLLKLADAAQNNTLLSYYVGADFVTQSSRHGVRDVSIASGTDNLAQAILHRLRTIKGELFDTGHPDYGCEIYNMIGEPNNEMTRERIKLMVKEALKQEPRISEIIDVQVYPRQIRHRSLSDHENSDDKKDSRRAFSPVLIQRKTHPYSHSVEDLNTVDIDIFVRPINNHNILGIEMPFSLESITT